MFGDGKLYRFSEKQYLVEIKKFYKKFGLLTYIITFKISTLIGEYLKEKGLKPFDKQTVNNT